MWSQDKRGGGTACIMNQQLWKALNWTFVSIDWCNDTIEDMESVISTSHSNDTKQDDNSPGG